MTITNFLASDSYIITNKLLIQLVGLDSAILLGEFCSEYNYWDKTNRLTDEKWFFSTRENIENNTGLSEYKQRTALNKLIELKLISIKRMGIPCKNYYKINENNILKLYEENNKNVKQINKNANDKNLKNLISSNENFKELDIKNLNINNNNTNNKSNNKEYNHPSFYKKSSYQNYEQRQYPDEFFNQFYANLK